MSQLAIAVTPSLPRPIGRPREFDRDRALDAAMRVFWRYGYEGASLTELTAAMGINRPSLYAAFGDKAALFREAVARYGAGPGRYVRRALGQPTARLVAETLLRGAVANATDPTHPGGCLWVHGALATGPENAPIRAEIAALRARGIAQIRARFDRALAEGDLPTDYRHRGPHALPHQRHARHRRPGRQRLLPRTAPPRRRPRTHPLARLIPPPDKKKGRPIGTALYSLFPIPYSLASSVAPSYAPQARPSWPRPGR